MKIVGSKFTKQKDIKKNKKVPIGMYVLRYSSALPVKSWSVRTSYQLAALLTEV